jgi:thymidine phosphorylase
MVRALGGPRDMLDRPWKHLERAPVCVPVLSTQPGVVGRIDTRQVGLAVVVLGGGRTRPQDAIDHAVGLSELLPVGTRVAIGDPLGVVHARSVADADRAATMVRDAYGIGRRTRVDGPVVAERIGA